MPKDRAGEPFYLNDSCALDLSSAGLMMENTLFRAPAVLGYILSIQKRTKKSNFCAVGFHPAPLLHLLSYYSHVALVDIISKCKTE